MKGMRAQIEIEKLHNHPDNVRQNYAGIEELAESVKNFGILQNLTVVPEPGHEETLDSFWVVIGNRRLKAAQIAGLSEIPCVIAKDMDRKVQISTMMAENMARNDLTPIEEGKGIQLMLDLGESMESIAEKIGRSRSTVKHRVELTKLSPELIEQRTAGKQREGFFQLSFTDLARLEKIDSIKKRNEILKDAKGPENLKFLIDNYIAERERKEYLDSVAKALEEKGVHAATKKEEQQRYNSGVIHLAYYDGFTKDKRKEIEIPKIGDVKKAFYVKNDYGVSLYEAGRKLEMSARDKKAEEKEKKRKEIMKIYRGYAARRKEFLLSVAIQCYTGRSKGEKFDLKEIWPLMLKAGMWINIRSVADILVEGKGEMITDMEIETAGTIPPDVQALILLSHNYENSDSLVNWDGSYKKDAGENVQKMYEFLAEYGYSPEPKEEQLINGTHELYARTKTGGH